jgi:hypothetical protein
VKLEEFEGPKYKRIDHLRVLLWSGRLDASLRWSSLTATTATRDCVAKVS